MVKKRSIVYKGPTGGKITKTVSESGRQTRTLSQKIGGFLVSRNLNTGKVKRKKV
jgi:hypothetical protein